MYSLGGARVRPPPTRPLHGPLSKRTTGAKWAEYSKDIKEMYLSPLNIKYYN